MRQNRDENRQDEFEQAIVLNLAQQLFEAKTQEIMSMSLITTMQITTRAWNSCKKHCGPTTKSLHFVDHLAQVQRRLCTDSPLGRLKEHGQFYSRCPPTWKLHACELDTGAEWTLQRVTLHPASTKKFRTQAA